MSAPVKVGREATHGTVASSLYSASGNFNSKPVVKNVIPDEQRGGQDINFSIIPGPTSQEWSLEDSPVYHDSVGFFLTSAMGLATSSLLETGVYSSVFKFTDDPPSVSLEWVQPRRAVQGYQSLWNVVDTMTFSFEAGGLLTYSCSGVGKTETEIATPTFSFSTAIPLTAWEGTVTLGGGAFTRLVSGSVTINRNRQPFWTINNSAAPIDMSIGNRTVDFELVVDFATKTEYDRYKTGGTTALTIKWEDADVLIGTTRKPSLELKLGTIGYTMGEIDTGSDFPSAKLGGKALYNGSDASKAVATVVSTRQYQTA